MKVNLVAVQARPRLEDYVSADAFYNKVSSLMQRVASSVDLGRPSLVAFPEAIGLCLSFVPFYYDRIKDCKTITQVMLRVIPRNLGPLLRTAWKHRVIGLRVPFIHTALEAEKIYWDAFSSLAQEYGVYLLAGSIYTPPIEHEPMKGRFIIEPRVQNTSYLFSPRGLCLRRIPKVNLVPPLEDRVGFSGGAKSELVPIDTPLGRIGILVCFDGFHRTLIEHYDALACDIVAKPSYNMHPWNAPWPGNPEISEGEAWLRYGLSSLIQGRENIRFGVNPMMVGKIFDLEAEGRSIISRNTGRTDAPREETIVAIAERSDEEEVVAATVEVAEERQRLAAPA